MQLGRFMGLFLVIIGLVFAWFALSMSQDAGVTLKLFLAGPAIVIVGIAMVFFPGGQITAKESREKTKDPQVVFTEAPRMHKIAWVVALVIGVIVTLVVF